MYLDALLGSQVHIIIVVLLRSKVQSSRFSMMHHGPEEEKNWISAQKECFQCAPFDTAADILTVDHTEMMISDEMIEAEDRKLSEAK